MSESDIDLFLDHWIIIRKDGTPVLNGNPEVFKAVLKEVSAEYDKDAPIPSYQWRIDDLKRDIAELEAENKRLTGALSLIERSTGGFANGVAKAALGEDE